MTKLQCALIATMLVVWNGCASETEVSRSQSLLNGDANRDQSINVVDILCTQKAVLWTLGGSNPASKPACLDDVADADHNCDGAVNVTDIQIVRYLAIGEPLSPVIDADGNDVVDACESVFGDVNGDGDVNVTDLSCMSNIVPWTLGPPDAAAPECMTSIEAADLDCDGVPTVTDILLSQELVFLHLTGDPLDPIIDADQNGVTDSCE